MTDFSCALVAIAVTKSGALQEHLVKPMARTKPKTRTSDRSDEQAVCPANIHARDHRWKDVGYGWQCSLCDEYQEYEPTEPKESQ